MPTIGVSSSSIASRSGTRAASRSAYGAPAPRAAFTSARHSAAPTGSVCHSCGVSVAGTTTPCSRATAVPTDAGSSIGSASWTSAHVCRRTGCPSTWAT